MKLVLGVLRFTVTAIVLVLGGVAVILASLLPVHIDGVRPASWLVVGMARLVALIFGVRISCRDPLTLQRHRGFIFPNHSSALDTLVLVAQVPARFLSAAEVVNYPVIGWIARSIGTIFVARTSEGSRRKARRDIVGVYQAAPRRPIVLFPEGKLGPGDRLLPFRYGAFEMAVANGVAYLPCALRYRPLEVAIWRGAAGEELWSAGWRLACRTGPLTAEVIPLAPVHPTAADDPTQLAEQARLAIAEALGISTEPAPSHTNQ